MSMNVVSSHDWKSRPLKRLKAFPHAAARPVYVLEKAGHIE